MLRKGLVRAASAKCILFEINLKSIFYIFNLSIYKASLSLNKDHQKFLRHNQLRAMKMMDQNEIADNELLVLMRLEHDNVLKYFDHFQFQFKIADVRSKVVTKLCVITEFCQVISSFIQTSFFKSNFN